MERKGGQEPPKTVPKTCAIEGCDKKTASKGLCGMHLQRLRKHGDVNYTAPRGRPKTAPDTCLVPHCGKRVIAFGLCWGHYQRKRRGAANDNPLMCRINNKEGECIIPGCTNARKNSGLCSHHFYLYKKYGDPFWVAPTKEVREVKYFPLFCNGKYYSRNSKSYQHRDVMESFLGRKLNRTEIVRFKNGDTMDCGIENLYIVSQKQVCQEREERKRDRRTNVP